MLLYQFLFWVCFALVLGDAQLVPSFPQNTSTYGPFTTAYENCTNCPGYRGNSYGYENGSFLERDGEKYNLCLKCIVTKKFGPVGLRLRFSQIKGGTYKPTLNFHYEDCCKHFITKTLVRTVDYVTNNCFVLPGNRVLVARDMGRMLQTLVGENFFYGVYRLQVQIFAPKVMIIYLRMILRIVKVVKENK